MTSSSSEEIVLARNWIFFFYKYISSTYLKMSSGVLSSVFQFWPSRMVSLDIPSSSKNSVHRNESITSLTHSSLVPSHHNPNGRKPCHICPFDHHLNACLLSKVMINTFPALNEKCQEEQGDEEEVRDEDPGHLHGARLGWEWSHGILVLAFSAKYIFIIIIVYTQKEVINDCTFRYNGE